MLSALDDERPSRKFLSISFTFTSILESYVKGNILMKILIVPSA